MIDDFRGDYRWLSNFHMVEVTFEGKKYPSTEHAYQAAKTLDDDARELFTVIPTAKEAKKMGGKLKLRKDWEQVKLSVMENVLREKFKDPELAKKLLDTGNQELREGNWWGDEFWGVDNKTGAGKNHLGKLLMKIRAELRLQE